MPRYNLFIEYEGTHYSGWQIQPNAPTVQEELEQALHQILREKIHVTGQGRTDSGVHAEAQVAHVDIVKPVIENDLLYALLGVLPHDIAVWGMQKTQPDFHARFDAISRQYRYQIVTRPSPLLNRFAEQVRYDLDWEAMKVCAAMIKGRHDFACFSKSDKDQSNAICTIEHSALEKEGHIITYRIRGNRFVRHMVRRLVGAMLQVGKGKENLEHFSDLLHHPDEEKNSYGAPAKGLILEKVKY